MQRLRDLGSAVSNKSYQVSFKCIHTPRVGVAPEDNRSALVLGVSEHLVQHDGEAVEVANVKRAKVGVECIVQQVLVDREVDWRERRSGGCGRLGSGGALRW